MAKIILSYPDKKWTPEELIGFSREKQNAIGRPGERFYYSNTGYTLLLYIIEKVTGKKPHELVEKDIFEPVDMVDSYSLFYSKAKHQPQKSIAKIWFNGEDIADHKSLSVGLADIGIVSTLSDLERFIKALFDGMIISEESLGAMRAYDQRFQRGIHYGQGMMQVRFGEFFSY